MSRNRLATPDATRDKPYDITDPKARGKIDVSAVTLPAPNSEFSSIALQAQSIRRELEGRL